MRKIMAVALAALLSGSVFAQAWAAGPEGWAYRQEIGGIQKESPLQSLVLPPSLLGKAQVNLGDLRIFDEGGKEIPYALGDEVQLKNPNWQGAPYNQGVLPDGKRTATVDLSGAKLGFHHQAILTVSGSDYLATVIVEGSADGTNWAQVGGGVLLDRPTKLNTVTYKAVDYRYLRFTLETKEGKPGELLSVQVIGGTTAGKKAEEALGEAIPAGNPAKPSSDNRAMIWEWQLNGQGPISDVTLTGVSGDFERKVVVKTSTDGKNWRDAGRGMVFRYPGSAENLRISFPKTAGEYWQVWLYHENDQPLAGAQMSLHVPKTEIYFEPQNWGTGKSYLYYGNRNATAPHYDLTSLLSRQGNLTATPASLGAEENLGGTDPNAKPWTEENPWVLRVVLGLMVVVLGLILARSFKRSKEQGEK